jgi:hypothetical protein
VVKNICTKNTACYIIRKLNEKYMKDQEIVNIQHCLTISELGIKYKINDCEFLMSLVDLINGHGPTIVFGKLLIKVLPYLI